MTQAGSRVRSATRHRSRACDDSALRREGPAPRHELRRLLPHRRGRLPVPVDARPAPGQAARRDVKVASSRAPRRRATRDRRHGRHEARARVAAEAAQFDQRAIAAAAEGKLKSAFAGRPTDGVERARPRAEHKRACSSSRRRSSSTNPFASPGNGPDLGGQFAMMGAVGGDEELLMIAGRTRSSTSPTPSSRSRTRSTG